MSDSRSIQPYGGKVPAGAIMTPQGPAIIQVIDMPSRDLALDQGGSGFKPQRPAGMHIFGAVLRRWWLVVLMTAVIGGAGVFAGSHIKPSYDGLARVSFHDPNADAYGRGSVRNIINSAEVLITSQQIPLIAAHDPELQAAMPLLLKNRDLDDPIVQADVVAKLKGTADTAEEVRNGEVVDVITTQESPQQAIAVANAFARAFVKYCQTQLTSQIDLQYAEIDQEVKDGQAALAKFNAALLKLKNDTNFDVMDRTYASDLEQVGKINGELQKARVDYAAAQSAYEAFLGNGERRPEQELERLKLIDEAKTKDGILKAADEELMAAENNLAQLLASGMTPDHPSVKDLAVPRIERAKQNVAQRIQEISHKIEDDILKQQQLEDASTMAKAQAAKDAAQKMVTFYTTELNGLNERTHKMGPQRAEMDSLVEAIAHVKERNKETSDSLYALTQLRQQAKRGGNFAVADWATKETTKLKEDKSIKVEAAGMVGGLFLGILLALLVDKFDKRLRDPRDLEPIFSAPLLGTIPRIQELKRAKGEQARNLIAEEFRIIRTQILFGNPQLKQKIIIVTSPAPGDGKTSLAVNLAISIAKSGRRCLLIDGDLRKPDIHRVFNIPEFPGFAELIQGSHEAGAVIRKSEIDGLDLLAAGTPINRPSELLSRPDMQRILTALGEMYDHVILDTAPLLPVSDTHILVGMVDGVICSFNAEVDRDVVNLTQEILRRCHATVIGTVMNQVSYKKSGSYHRGKSAYDSYYNSPRSNKPSREAALAPLGK